MRAFDVFPCARAPCSSSPKSHLSNGSYSRYWSYSRLRRSRSSRSSLDSGGEGGGGDGDGDEDAVEAPPDESSHALASAAAPSGGVTTASVGTKPRRCPSSSQKD